MLKMQVRLKHFVSVEAITICSCCLLINKMKGKKMGKLIDNHMSDPTQKNLDKILKYSEKHPFAWMMISKEQAEYLAQQLKGIENV